MHVNSKSKSKSKRMPSVASSAPNTVRRSASAVSATRLSSPQRLAEDAAQPPMPCRLITRAALSQIVPYTGQHILRLEKIGKFPRRIKVGPNRVAWLLSEVEAWVAARVAERDSSPRF